MCRTHTVNLKNCVLCHQILSGPFQSNQPKQKLLKIFNEFTENNRIKETNYCKLQTMKSDIDKLLAQQKEVLHVNIENDRNEANEKNKKKTDILQEIFWERLSQAKNSDLLSESFDDRFGQFIEMELSKLEQKSSIAVETKYSKTKEFFNSFEIDFQSELNSIHSIDIKQQRFQKFTHDISWISSSQAFNDFFNSINNVRNNLECLLARLDNHLRSNLHIQPIAESNFNNIIEKDSIKDLRTVQVNKADDITEIFIKQV